MDQKIRINMVKEIEEKIYERIQRFIREDKLKVDIFDPNP